MNLNEPQSRVIVSDRDIVIMQAGTGSGKTSVLALWLKMEMERKGPGERGDSVWMRTWRVLSERVGRDTYPPVEADQ